MVSTAVQATSMKSLSLVILEFKKLIEEEAEIFRDFHEMFDQVPSNLERNQLSVSGLCRNY